MKTAKKKPIKHRTRRKKVKVDVPVIVKVEPKDIIITKPIYQAFIKSCTKTKTGAGTCLIPKEWPVIIQLENEVTISGRMAAVVYNSGKKYKDNEIKKITVVCKTPKCCNPEHLKIKS